MDIQTTTSRLRRTFAYPTDDDPSTADNADEPALDEQEQEALIESIAAQNARRNQQFTLFLLALPLLSTLPYLLDLLHPAARVDALIAVLAITSLGSTAWLLWSLPPGMTGIGVVDRWVYASGGGNARLLGGRGRGVHQQKSPLELFLPYLNMGLCGVLIVTGLVSKAHAPLQWGHVGLGNLPAVVYLVVVAAKVVMGGVDPERELSALRYEYKGA